jgi:apolipoprotein N-acyltransferase
MLSFAFFNPALGACCIFFFLIPVYLIALSSSLSFIDGFYWGLLFFSIHLYGLLQLLHERAEGTLRVGAGILFIIYCALNSGLWFWGATFLSSINKTKYLKCFAWVITTLCYFFWVEQGMLWPFGNAMGYCFGSPLLVLVYYPQTLSIFLHAGPVILLFIISLYAMCCAFLCAHDTIKTGCVLIIIPIVILNIIKSPQEIMPMCIQNIGYLKPPQENKEPFEQAHEINSELTKLLHKYENLRTVIMPESSFTKPLNLYPDILELWAENALSEGINLIIGSPRTNNNDEYNSLYNVHMSRIINFYDKKTCMPFTEQLPFPWNKFNFCQTLFLKDKKGFSTNENSQNFFTICNNLTVEPKLCSDLFFGPCNPSNSCPILFAVNDSWISAAYLKRLMHLFAVYKAITLQREIIYISHERGCWITKKGTSIPLRA